METKFSSSGLLGYYTYTHQSHYIAMIAFATISMNDIFFVAYAISCSKKYILQIKHLVDVPPE